MKSVLQYALALSAYAAGALGTQLIKPSQDPWYTAPEGFVNAAPGTILRTREAPSNVSLLIDNASAVYQLLYRSRDTHYRPSWAVTTVYLPKKAAQAKRDSRALLSYQIPYNSITVDESPSYGLSTLYGEAITTNIQYGLSQGWAVSVPDFEGPKAAFSAGPQAGQAVLDGVRAVLAFDKYAGPKKVRYALWGYSGGAHASGFAAELQDVYAPELNFAGVALGGVTSNFTEILFDVVGQVSVAIIPYSLLGITNAYPRARQYLVDHLKTEGPYNATTFLGTLERQPEQNLPIFNGTNPFDFFTNGAKILEAPLMKRIIGNNWIFTYHGIPQMPVFNYKAINDENISIQSTDEHIARWCSVGANVLYQRNTVGGHEDEYVARIPFAREWLGRVLDGEQVEPRSGCQVETVTVAAPAARL